MLKHGGQFSEEVIDFSVNVNPVVSEEMMGSLLEKHRAKALCYPEIDGAHLERKIEAKYDIKEGCVYVGNGASDCLYQLAKTLKPKSVLLIEPTFTEYKRAFEQSGAVVLPLPYAVEGDQQQIEAQILGQIKKIKADMVVLCNPNNPTGHCYSSDFITSVVKAQKVHKGYVLVDESFRFFESIDSCYNKDLWNLVVLTSLTKYYGIPGLRIGYLSTNISLIESMRQQQIPWSMNGLALAITSDLMDDTSHDQKTNEWYKAEKAFMYEGLSALKYLEPLNSRGNYFLCKILGTKGNAINEWLLGQEKRTAIRTCTDFEGLGDGYFRIGLRSHEDNALLIEQLKAFEEVV